MGGFEWIPIQRHVHTSREVLIIARDLKMSRNEAVGLIVGFLSWVDGETIDGILPGLVFADIDEAMACPGLAASMERAEMLRVIDPQGLYVPNFRLRHGPSARARLDAHERKLRQREKKRATAAHDDEGGF